MSSARTSSVTAGPPVRITSISATGRPSIPGKSETRGSMHVTTAILGAGCFPSAGLYVFAYSRFASTILSMILIICLHEGHAKTCTPSDILISSTYQIRGATVNPSDEGVDDTFVSPDQPISSRDERRCLDDVFHER